jgi:hypothetical protein
MDKKKINKVLAIVFMMAAGACVGYLGAQFGAGSARSLPGWQLTTLLVLAIPAFFVVVGVHEAGHAVAGALVKFDFRMYVVGPFMWDKEATGWKFKWNKNVNLSGGMVICLPTTSENLAKRFSIYVLGGPVASVIFAALAYSVRLAAEALNVSGSPVLDFIALLFGVLTFLSVIIFMMTIIPLHIGGFYTDGARALRFLRGGDTGRFEVLLMTTMFSSCGGVRPSLLNIDEINEALALAKKLNAPMKVYVLYYLYQVALDKGQHEEAEAYLKEYIAEVESIPKGLRGSVFMDATFFYASVRKDLERAEFYWKQYEPSALLPKAQALATEAAILNLRGDLVARNEKIEMALKELPNMIDRGVAISLREKLMEINLTQSAN